MSVGWMRGFAVLGTLVLQAQAPSVPSATTPGREGRERRVTGDPRQATGPAWDAQVIRATGVGAPDLRAPNIAAARIGAEKAALADALRNLLAQVQGVRIAGDRTMADAMARDEVRQHVEGLLRGYRVSGKRYFSDGGVEIDVEVSASLLTDVFDPDTTLELPAVSGKTGQETTGLIIDARGLKLLPALAPRVLAPNGKAIYSVDVLALDVRRRAGVAYYVPSLEEAEKSGKAGNSPLIVKAHEARGTDVMLGQDMVDRLAQMNTGFLKSGKVVFVVGAAESKR